MKKTNNILSLLCIEKGYNRRYPFYGKSNSTAYCNLLLFFSRNGNKSPHGNYGPFLGRTKGWHDKNRSIQNLAQPDEFQKCLSARRVRIESAGSILHALCRDKPRAI